MTQFIQVGYNNHAPTSERCTVKCSVGVNNHAPTSERCTSVGYNNHTPTSECCSSKFGSFTLYCIETVLACHILFFPEGFPPDGTPLTILLTYHTALVVLYYLLALFGTTLSAVLFIFNFVFRKAK